MSNFQIVTEPGVLKVGSHEFVQLILINGPVRDLAGKPRRSTGGAAAARNSFPTSFPRG